MKIIKSLIACFSTYSRIPMPVVELDSQDMKYSMIFFPLIGVIIGIFEYLLFVVCNAFSLPTFFRTCLIAVIPIIVTGGIHLDGYIDTMDALNSYGSKEKKLTILKDPHVGAFAIIYLAVYGLLFLAFSYLINEKSIIPLCYGFVISRIICGLSVVTIENAKHDGMIHDLKNNTDSKTVKNFLIAFFIVTICVLLANDVYIKFAVLAVTVSVIGYILYKDKVMKEFGGITGDTSGFFVCILEIVFLVMAVLGGLA